MPFTTHESENYTAVRLERTADSNGAATLALVLGIVAVITFGFLTVSGIIAISFSAVALSRAKKLARAGGLPAGRTKARIGLALGIVAILMSVLVVFRGIEFYAG